MLFPKVPPYSQKLSSFVDNSTSKNRVFDIQECLPREYKQVTRIDLLALEPSQSVIAPGNEVPVLLVRSLAVTRNVVSIPQLAVVEFDLAILVLSAANGPQDVERLSGVVILRGCVTAMHG